MEPKKLCRRKESLVRQISTIGPVFRGSVAEVHLTCGKANCRCQEGQRHRAFYVSYRLAGEPRVAHVSLRWAEEAQKLRERWRRMKSLLEELADVQVALWKEGSDGREEVRRGKETTVRQESERRAGKRRTKAERMEAKAHVGRSRRGDSQSRARRTRPNT